MTTPLLRSGGLLGLGLLFAAVTLAGCMKIDKHEDLGQACLGDVEAWDSGADLVIAPGDPTAVTVVFSTCSSGSVDWTDQSCVLEVSDGEIRVTTFVRTLTPRRAQTDDCNWVSWDCGTVELDEGDYTLVYGAGEEPFGVPYEGGSICVDNG